MSKLKSILSKLAALEGNLDEELARLALLRSQGKLPLHGGVKRERGIQQTIRNKIDVFRSDVNFLEGQCWEWKRHCSPEGYGWIYIHRCPLLSHRFSFAVFNRCDPQNQVCHHCDNPKCVNPDHLFEGTQLENMRDCSLKGRNYVTSGEKNPKSKLTDAQVFEIRSSSLPTSKLVETYGVTRLTIWRAKTGYSWPHIPFPTHGS